MGGNNMQSEDSLYIRFVFPTKVAKFFEELKNHRLLTTRCVNCGDLRFPPSVDCPKCLGNEVEWVELKGKGKLLTYTTVHIAPTTFAKHVPYTIGIIALDEGPRMMARIVDTVPDGINIGMDVQVVFIEGFGGQPSYGFKPTQE
jgi:uncharacterized OB-fold protein